ncbi:MAG: hypothetical protein RLZZ618_4047 [Pseudomonadota bacterium]|jgi:hydroxypyruvate isomerase
MPRFAANLSWMYTEHPFLDRFEAAARDGFNAVEFLFPYEHDVQAIAAALRRHGLSLVLFNAPPGDWAAGDRGTASVPGREAEFRAGIVLALQHATALACPRVHVMSGCLSASPTAHAPVLLENLHWACAQAADAGVELLIEPINRRDMPGYFLERQAEAHAIVNTVGAANLKVQMDLYHCQITEGDVATRLREHLATGRVGHLQMAGVPERREPDDGELNYPYLFALIDSLGFEGHVGCEYRPRAGTSEGLAWLRRERARSNDAGASPR